MKDIIELNNVFSFLFFWGGGGQSANNHRSNQFKDLDLVG
jgi:hypothetical protein